MPRKAGRSGSAHATPQRRNGGQGGPAARLRDWKPGLALAGGDLPVSRVGSVTDRPQQRSQPIHINDAFNPMTRCVWRACSLSCSIADIESAR